MTNIRIDNILFYLEGNFTPILKFKIDNTGQGLIHFDNITYNEYCLYRWYDEGKFLEIFDTEHDRLKVVGVDEL